MEALYEAYSNFIQENSDDLGTPSGAIRMITDEGLFRSYAESLTQNLSEGVRNTVLGVMNRQREMFLTEAANVPASSFATGWTVISFPILVDIYSEPIIAELCNVYPTNSPILSIPRVRIKASTTPYDGGTPEEEYIPTATKMIRAGVKVAAVAPNKSQNVFTILSLDSSKLKMNRRYTLVTKIVLTDNDGTNDHTIEVPVNFRPDNRSQVIGDFDFLDSAGNVVAGKINGNIDYNKGTVLYQVILTGGTTGHTYEVEHAEFSLRFVPYGTMNGRTRVTVEVEEIDITIDPKSHWGLYQ